MALRRSRLWARAAQWARDRTFAELPIRPEVAQAVNDRLGFERLCSNQAQYADALVPSAWLWSLRFLWALSCLGETS